MQSLSRSNTAPAGSFGSAAVRVQLCLKLSWPGSSSGQHHNQLRLENTEISKGGRGTGAATKALSLSCFLPRIRAHLHTGTALWLISSPPNLYTVSQVKASLVLLKPPLAPQLQHAPRSVAGSDARTAAGCLHGKSAGCRGPCALTAACPLLQKEGSQRNTPPGPL